MWGAPNYPLRQVPDTFWSWNLLQWNSLWRYGTWWPHQSLHVTVLYFTFVFYRPKTTFVGLVSKKRCNNSLSLFKGGLLENTWTFRAYRGKDIQQLPRPPLLLELLRWNLGPGNNISLGISSGQRPLCSFCACSNDSFWNVVRRYRPAFWHVKMT